MMRFDYAATIKAEDQTVLAPESTPWHLDPIRRAEPRDQGKEADDLLGPHPKRTVETFHDLGMNDDEIAKYFATPLRRIKVVSDGGQRSDRLGKLREVAKLLRAKLFGGRI